MSKSIPYPSLNCVIVFREPFPRVDMYEGKKWYYVRAIIDDQPECQIRFNKLSQLRFIDNEIIIHKKILNAVIKCINGEFTIVSHSPQVDFFDMVSKKEAK